MHDERRKLREQREVQFLHYSRAVLSWPRRCLHLAQREVQAIHIMQGR